MCLVLLLVLCVVDVWVEIFWVFIVMCDMVLFNCVLMMWVYDVEIMLQLWGLYVVVNMLLNWQNQVLYWFCKFGFLYDDYLWLMSYVEVLDVIGQFDLVWCICCYVWLEVCNL